MDEMKETACFATYKTILLWYHLQFFLIQKIFYTVFLMMHPYSLGLL